MRTEYTTKDFYLASFLVASGFKLEGFTRSMDGITTFQFNGKDELSTFINGYYADTTTVSPIRYGNALKNMKAIIRNTYTNGNYVKSTGKGN
jgi:Domain of unknown function (DUF5659)